MSGTYAIQHEGRWYYHLGGRIYAGKPVYLANGSERMEVAELEGWWSSSEKASTIEKVVDAKRIPLAYELVDVDTASVRYPATLTVAEYDERTSDDPNYEARERFLYRAVSEEQEQPNIVVEVPSVVLKEAGAPKAQVGTWTATLPSQLTTARPYLFAFPGRLTGFRAVFEKWCQKQPHVHHAYNAADGFSLGFSIAREKPKTVMEYPSSRSRKKKPVVVKTERQHLSKVPVPQGFDGENYADAAAKWDEAWTEWTEWVTKLTTIVICDSCGGRGSFVKENPYSAAVSASSKAATS